MASPHRALIRWLRALTVRALVGFAAAIVAGAAFVVISAYVHDGAVDTVDVSTELEVHKLDSPTWDFAMKSASFVGSTAVLLPVVAVVIGIAIRKKKRAAAWILAIDTAASIGLDNLLKVIFARDRPTILDKIPVPTGYSFPSGHSMSAMAVWGVIIAVLIFLYPRIRLPAIACACVLIAAIGFSRIYLGAHWPFDVLGGFLGGIPLLVISVHLLHRNARRMGDTNLADVIVRSEKPHTAT